MMRRLMIGLTIAVGMSSALVVVLLVVVAWRGEEAALQRDVVESAAQASRMLEAPLWDLDMGRAARIGEAFAQDPRVAALSIHEASSDETSAAPRLNCSSATLASARLRLKPMYERS